MNPSTNPSRKGGVSNPIRPNLQGVFPQVEDGVWSVALGNGTQYRIMIIRPKSDDECLWVGVEGCGCACFAVAPDANKDEIAGIKYPGDAANFADFVGDQLGLSLPRHGHYYPTLCEGGAK